MRKLQVFLKDDLDRKLVFGSCGAIVLLVCQFFPGVRPSAFLISLGFSILAGLSSTRGDQAFRSAVAFFTGFPIGILIFLSVGFVRMKSFSLPLLLDLLIVASALGLMVMTVWFVGAPIGFFTAVAMNGRKTPKASNLASSTAPRVNPLPLHPPGYQESREVLWPQPVDPPEATPRPPSERPSEASP